MTWSSPRHTVGEMLADAFKVTTTNDRGVPCQPLAIVMDQYAGFHGSRCNQDGVNAWGALNATAPLLAAIDLLDEQLVPGGS